MRLLERWTWAAALAAAGAFAVALGGCGVHSLTPDDGGAGGAAGTGIIVEPPNPLLSDFEDPAQAVIVRSGGRNGFWYAYNDAANGCNQIPAPGVPCIGEAPPTLAPGTSGSLALHAVWKACTTWGAGIGADINLPLSNDSGQRYAGPPLPYDLSGYGGLTFWAMATRGSDINLRFEMVMRAATLILDGGTCDENVVGPGKCSDQWGQVFQLPADGSWYPVKINFSSPSFHQEGWGAAFSWDPSDVTGVRIQSVDAGPEYDFWIDDMYLYFRP